MMKRRFFHFLAAIALTQEVFATDVTTTPGRLAERLAETDVTDRILRISGILGPDDFETLRNLEGVDRLDLGNASLTEALLTAGLVESGHWPMSTSLPAYALFATSYREIILPPTLTHIREGALASTAVENLAIPEGVEAIGAYALYEAASLKTLTLPTTLLSIGTSAFDGCSALTSINLGATKVTALPYRCLARTSALSSAELSEIITAGEEALYGSGIKNIDMPAARSIGSFAFAGMERLETVNLAGGAVIGTGAMMNCPKLKSVTGTPAEIPDLFAAESRAYSPADAMRQATQVGDFAFANTAADTFVLLPGLSRIGGDAFAGCSDIYEIDASALAGFIPETSPTVFRGVSTESVRLKVAKGCENIWQNHPVWGYFLIYSGNLNNTDQIMNEETGMTFRADSEGFHAASPLPGITIEVYTLEGHRVAAAGTRDSELHLPLSSLPAGTLVGVARDSEGGIRTLKIIH